MGRTFQEYENEFGRISDDILSQPFETKAEARHGVALANKAVRKRRNEFTEEITKLWKEGYRQLKAENDQMQNDLKEWFVSSQNDVWNRYPKVKGRRDVAATHEMDDIYKGNVMKRNEISQRWKEGFAVLKAENDQMQKDLAKAFKDELESIDERLGDIFEAIEG